MVIILRFKTSSIQALKKCKTLANFLIQYISYKD